MALVYLAIAWSLGIWLARVGWSAGWMDCAKPALPAWIAMLLLPLAGLLLGRRWSGVRLPAVGLLLLLLGAWRYQAHPFEPCFSPQDLAFYNGSAAEPAWATVIGLVERPPEPRSAGQRVRIDAERLIVGQGQERRSVAGNALFTVDLQPALRYGDRVAATGWLETPPEFEDFSYKDYLARQGVHSMIQRPEVTLLGRDQGSLFWSALYGLRARAQEAIARLLPEPEAALLTGILLGVETGIPKDLYDQFNRTGTSHIIVISGFNITIIAGLMAAVFGRLMGKRRAFYAVVAGIAFYTLLVGAEAAVTRAAIMGGLCAWAAYLGRRSMALASLFAAGLVMTLLNPLALWDVGFQLSFMATLSLVLFATPLTQRFEAALAGRLPAGAGRTALNFLNDALIVTLAAQVLTLPLVAYYFGRVSLVSPLANLLVLPVQPYVMIWGGFAVLTGLPAGLLWPLARLLALIPWLALHWTVWVVQSLSALPFASIAVNVSLAALWGFYALLGVVMLSSRPSLPLIGALLPRVRGLLSSSASTTAAAAALLVVGALLALALGSLPDGKLHVHFLDVGRGEAVLIETPDGQQALIDGGQDPTALLSALGQRMPFYDRQIELVVVTHPGDERVGGLTGLAERYRIAQVLQAPFPYASAAYESWLRTLQEHAVPVASAEAGARVDLGYGLTLDVLHPGPEPALTKAGELDVNSNSLALRLAWGDISFLLLGDASKAVQENLAASGLIQPASVVELPQGGKQAAFSQALLEAAQPQRAVVFTQRDDRFRDLSAPVEAAWVARVGAEGFQRTDLAGTVSFESDGHTIAVSSGQ